MDGNVVGAVISGICSISMLQVAPWTTKIARDRARAVVAIPSRKIEDVKDAPWVHNLRCIILMDTLLP